jgi:hypothetical protein
VLCARFRPGPRGARAEEVMIGSRMARQEPQRRRQPRRLPLAAALFAAGLVAGPVGRPLCATAQTASTGVGLLVEPRGVPAGSKATAGTAGDGSGRTTTLSALDVPETAKTLNFELVDAKIVGPVLERVPGSTVATQSTLPRKLSDVRFDGAAGFLRKRTIRNEARRQPYRHFMPALNGATGLIDMPVAYTLQKKSFAVSVQTERVRADERYWTLPYRSVNADSRYFTLNYGVARNVEAQIDAEMWDRDFRYNDPVRSSHPVFSVADKSFIGLGSKWTFPFLSTTIERMWFGMGFRIQFYDNVDRNVTEIHEYERHSNIYWVLSTKATKELFGHLMIKYISYDFRGGTPPSGSTPTFQGFAPTNYWNQWGIAFEWYMFPDLVVFTEITTDTDVVFVGNLKQINWNAGARYHTRDFGVGFFAKRINFEGFQANGIQASYRF